MSIRAYRVNKIERETNETFCITGNDIIFDYLLNEGLTEQLNDYGGGYLELSVEQLKEICELECLQPEDKEAIQKDIEFAEQHGGSITYDCF